MEDESFCSPLDHNQEMSSNFSSSSSMDTLLLSDHLLTSSSPGDDLDCPIIFPHPQCLPPPSTPLHPHHHQPGSLSPRYLAQSAMAGSWTIAHLLSDQETCQSLINIKVCVCVCVCVCPMRNVKCQGIVQLWVEIYPEYELYPESLKDYHPTYQELDLSHTSHSSFTQSRYIERVLILVYPLTSCLETFSRPPSSSTTSRRLGWTTKTSWARGLQNTRGLSRVLTWSTLLERLMGLKSKSFLNQDWGIQSRSFSTL